MEHIGIDVHKNESQICILTENGELVLERRIHTTRERLATVLGERPPAKVLIEASTESEWVARCIEGLGHEVIVANPNFSAMYATRSRKVKTDRRDARTLADACRLGAYRPSHRASDNCRHIRAQLAVREVLVRSRAKYVTLAGALLRREGLRVGGGSAECFPGRVYDLGVPGRLLSEVGPLLAMILQLNRQITWVDDAIEAATASDSSVQRLKTLPYIGTIPGSRVRRRPRSGPTLHRCAPSRVVPWPGAARAQLWREAMPRPHHQGRVRPRSLATCRGRVVDALVPTTGCRLASRLGETYRCPARPQGGCRSAGAAPGRHHVRADARPGQLRTLEDQLAEGGHNQGGMTPT